VQGQRGIDLLVIDIDDPFRDDQLASSSISTGRSPVPGLS
jgi:hypothetical protein